MTLEEFLRRLEKTPRAWDLDCYDRIRVGGASLGCCPIEAAAGLAAHLLDGYLSASEVLGLPWRLTRSLMAAADSSARCNRAVRARLLRACGLASPRAQRGRP